MPQVLIIECLRPRDPGSEGHFLLNMFNILEVKAQYLQLETKEQMLAIMCCVPNSVNFIHFTTHGTTRCLWTPQGDVEICDLKDARPDLSEKCVVTSACNTGDIYFEKRFRYYTKCKYFIAPKDSVSFKNAMFFSHLLYYNYFVLKKDIDKSFQSYTTRYRNRYKWKLRKNTS